MDCAGPGVPSNLCFKTFGVDFIVESKYTGTRPDMHIDKDCCRLITLRAAFAAELVDVTAPSDVVHY